MLRLSSHYQVVPAAIARLEQNASLGEYFTVEQPTAAGLVGASAWYHLMKKLP
jgi:hypothetical protein